MTDRAIPPSLRDGTDQPIFERSAGRRLHLRDGLRRLPALDLQYNPLSTARRQPGILMHVHPVLRWNLKLQQPQLPRSEPDGQPPESSQLARSLDAGLVQIAIHNDTLGHEKRPLLLEVGTR